MRIGQTQVGRRYVVTTDSTRLRKGDCIRRYEGGVMATPVGLLHRRDWKGLGIQVEPDLESIQLQIAALEEYLEILKEELRDAKEELNV